MTERAKKLLLLYCKQGGKIRRVSGLPLLTFKAKKAGTLRNYRIYGQTSRNLFDENSLISGSTFNLTWYFDDEHYLLATNKTEDNRPWGYSYSQFHIALSSGTYTIQLSGVATSNQSAGINITKSNNDDIWSKNITGKTNSVMTFTLNKPETIGIEIKVLDGKFRIMLNSGSTALPYEPYGESVGDRTWNLFDGEFLQGCWAGTDGSYLANYPTWICTDKLPCKPNTAYTLSFNSANSRWYGFFGSQKTETIYYQILLSLRKPNAIIQQLRHQMQHIWQLILQVTQIFNPVSRLRM